MILRHAMKFLALASCALPALVMAQAAPAYDVAQTGSAQPAAGGSTSPTGTSEQASGTFQAPGANSPSSVAGETPAAITTDQDNGIADIVVTAQRRAETAQRTPLAITAVGGESLNRNGIINVTDLTRRVPNVQIASDSVGTTLLSIRGVGSTDTTESGDPTVALNVDGIYIARNTSMSGIFYDIDRVEVLRGPQGTLYGRSATGGAINIISNQPVFKFEGAGSIEAGNYATFGSQGMLNVPLSDTVAVRAAFSSRRHDGYADNGNGLHTKDQDDVAGRVQFLAKPLEKLTIHLGVDYFHAGGNGGGFRGVEQPYPFQNPDNPYKYPLQAPHKRDQRDVGVRGQIDYDLGFGTLTYLGGFRNTNAYIQGQLAYFNLPYILRNKRQDQTSHEVRLGGAIGGLTYVVGGNLFKEDNDVNLIIDRAPIGAPAVQFIKPRANATSKGVFGQATYTLVPRLRLTGGVRYTKDRKYSFDGRTNLITANGTVTQVGTQNLSTEFSKVTYRGGIDYDLSPTSLLYASVASGYKPGGYFDGTAPNTYKPETVTSYEIGSKNRFLDNTLQANLTGFLYDYRDFQVSATRQVAGALAGITLNAQKARIYGVELETIYRITPADELNFTVGYLHARYKTFFLPVGDGFTNFGRPTGATPVPLDLSGQRIARSPDFTFNVGYQHRFELYGGGAVTAGFYTHVETKQNMEYHNYDLTKKPAFSRTDLSLGYQAPGGRWYVNAYLRNLEDRGLPILINLNTLTNNPNSAGASLEPPRTFGAILGVKF